ncbi:alaserpin-like [Tribolium castaneum]|uniref:alaserpin-like n=1 Tax=Tribolium castaneum TaxID=7070 RepID=UPI0030FED038
MNFVPFLIVTLAFAKKNAQQPSTDFCASLYKELANKTGNFIASPFLIESTFAALYLGSGGTTAEEIRTVLHLPQSNEEIEEKFKNLLVPFSNQGYNLHIANKFYVKESFLLNPIWQKQVRDFFQIESSIMDFDNKIAMVEKINHWIREQTNNKIDKIVSVEAFRDSPESLILGALYFQADWAWQFSTMDTIKAPFYKKPNLPILVDMMQRKKQVFSFVESDTLDAKFLELPFQSYEASMVLVLPNKIDGLCELEAKIDQVLQFRDFRSMNLDVFVPKFRIESKLDLKEILTNLGLKTVFNDTEAALYGLVTTGPWPYITKATQKTFLEINERGVEAAAGQKLLFGMPRSAISFNHEFKANHPFMFYIKIRNLVVFVGRVVDL